MCLALSNNEQWIWLGINHDRHQPSSPLYMNEKSIYERMSFVSFSFFFLGCFLHNFNIRINFNHLLFLNFSEFFSSRWISMKNYVQGVTSATIKNVFMSISEPFLLFFNSKWNIEYMRFVSLSIYSLFYFNFGFVLLHQHNCTNIYGFICFLFVAKKMNINAYSIQFIFLCMKISVWAKNRRHFTVNCLFVLLRLRTKVAKVKWYLLTSYAKR